MIDERIHRELTGLTDHLTPRPDPYGRVLARYRQGRRRRIMAVAGSGLALATLAATVPLVLHQRTGPQPAVGASEDNVETWRQRLITSAPRGALAKDATFVRGLVEALAEAPGTGPDLPIRPSTPRVLFADDIADLRVAGVVFVTDEDRRAGQNGQDTLLWLTAPRGATPEHLAAAFGPHPPADAGFSGGAQLDPFQVVDLGQVQIGFAPDGCAVAAAPLPAVSNWTVAPTRTYLIRAGVERQAEWWRVTCGGVVRASEPAPGRLPGNGDGDLTDAQVDAALARGRTPGGDRAALRNPMETARSAFRYVALELPTVVWSGRLSGTGSLDGDGAAILSAPTVDGDWLCMVAGQSGPDGRHFTLIRTAHDPTDRTAVVALSLFGRLGATVVVLPPSGTHTVRLVQDGRTVAEGTVAGGGVAVHTVPVLLDGTVAQAFDGNGRMIASGPVAQQTDFSGGRTNRWNLP